MKSFSETLIVPNELDPYVNDTKSLIAPVPDHLLAPVGPGGKWRAYWKAAKLFNAFFADVRAEHGVELTIIPGSTSAYRPLAAQVALFKSRFTTFKYTGSKTSRTYEGKTWWLKPGMALAATPGNSTHGLGLAIDAMFSNGRALDRATINKIKPIADRYMLRWTVSSEFWHIAAVHADAAHAAHFEKPVEVPPPAPPLAFDWTLFARLPVEAFATLPVLRQGAVGLECEYVRRSLAGVGNQPDCPINDTFDQDLEDRVRRFQQGWREWVDGTMIADGVVGQQTYMAFYIAWAFSSNRPW
jgi:hypothetical protein